VLFDGVEQAAGWAGAAGFIGEEVFFLISLHGNEEEHTALADEGFDEVAAVVVLGHDDLFPIDEHLSAIAHCFDILYGAVEGGFWQGGFVDVDGIDIAGDLDDGFGNPAAAVEVIGFDPEPAAVFIAAVHFGAIPGVEAVGVEIGFAGPVAAESLHEDGDIREIEGGGGSDGGRRCYGRRGGNGGSEGGGEGRRGGGCVSGGWAGRFRRGGGGFGRESLAAGKQEESANSRQIQPWAEISQKDKRQIHMFNYKCQNGGAA